jgi:glutamine synthetase
MNEPSTIKTFVEYVWIDADANYRSKTKVMHKRVEHIDDIPVWNFDGSSTKQSITHDNTEIVLEPVALFKDPFRGLHHKMVLCECFDPYGDPIETNTRSRARKIFASNGFDSKSTSYEYDANVKKSDAWFGMEQEYFIIDPKTNEPLGYDNSKEQGDYYCSVHKCPRGWQLANYHMGICAYAGINICGINAEVAPGQFEFQIGTCHGIEIGDHLHMARHLLHVCASMLGLSISFEPKVLKGSRWNGSGCHTNFSTKKMRQGTKNKNGYFYIRNAIKKLKKKHDYHMEFYGDGNEERMTGENETAYFDEFSWSVGGRNVSVRIGNDTFHDKQGYFEDRRPSSNCDPYIVASLIFETCCGETP